MSYDGRSATTTEGIVALFAAFFSDKFVPSNAGDASALTAEQLYVNSDYVNNLVLTRDEHSRMISSTVTNATNLSQHLYSVFAKINVNACTVLGRKGACRGAKPGPLGRPCILNQ